MHGNAYYEEEYDIEVLRTAGIPGYEPFFTDIAKQWMEQGGGVEFPTGISSGLS